MLKKSLMALALVGAAATHGATVTVTDSNGDCGDTAAPGRYVDVGGALVGGYCAYQEGNLQNADITALGLTLIEKDTSSSGGNAGLLQFTGQGSSSGTFSIASSVWSAWETVYLAFHFGNGGGSPDSFITELSRVTLTGSWSLKALAPDTVNNISNVYLLRDEPRQEVPVPGTLGLLGLGLVGLGLVRRTQKA